MKTVKKIFLSLLIVVVFVIIYRYMRYNHPSPGIWKDDVYTDNFADLTFHLPDNWHHYTTEELNNSTRKQRFLMPETKYAMKAENPNTHSVLTIAYEYVDIKGQNGIDEQTYIQTHLKQTMPKHLSFEYSQVETKALSGHTYTTITMSLPGTIDIGCLYVRRVDNYMVGILLLRVNRSESFEEIMSHFDVNESASSK